MMNAEQRAAAYQESYEDLSRALANPPAGWFPFGHHVDRPDVTRLEWWGTGADGMPLWERPAIDLSQRVTVGEEDADQWCRVTQDADGTVRVTYLEGVVTIHTLELPAALAAALGDVLGRAAE